MELVRYRLIFDRKIMGKECAVLKNYIYQYIEKWKERLCNLEYEKPLSYRPAVIYKTSRRKEGTNAVKTLLLTGFEPFLNFTINPTMRIVEELHGQEIGDYNIHSEVLPVDFRKSGKLLIQHIEKIKPDALISLGLAGGRYKITPERIAINVNDGESDNSGNALVDETIQDDGAEAYMSTLPIRAMVNRLLDEGLPAEISNTAGTYLCNHVMYQGLHYAKIHNQNLPSGFIHIPASHELAIQHGRIPSWSHEDLKRGIISCINVLSENS